MRTPTLFYIYLVKTGISTLPRQKSSSSPSCNPPSSDWISCFDDNANSYYWVTDAQFNFIGALNECQKYKTVENLKKVRNPFEF